MGTDVLLLVGGLFLLVCVMASKLSARLGVPALILFIGVGMLAGSDGPGKIHFDDFRLTKELGMVLLGFILFAGGMDTPWDHLKSVAKRGIALATIGVAVTAGLVGTFAHFVLGATWIQGLLLGSIVSSTDAAAIFGVLRSRGFALKHGISQTLEIESGTNDPVAVFLTLGMTQLAVNPDTSPLSLIPSLLMQMPIGVLVGLLFGRATIWLINRIKLEYDGLYPVVTISCAATTFGFSHLVHGNEFLAVYVAGLVLGSSVFVHRTSLVQFHDGLAWLLQITVFLALGLLVFPHQIAPVAASGMLLALFLMFVARPAAVTISLAAAHASRKTKAFIAWAGLRGAFPIILATIPILAGLEGGHQLFHLVFFVVSSSVLFQGVTMRPLARKLNLLVQSERDTGDVPSASSSQLFEIVIQPDSPIAQKQVVELGLPSTALLVLLKRGAKDIVPRGSTIIQCNDKLLIATRRDDRDDLIQMLGGKLMDNQTSAIA